MVRFIPWNAGALARPCTNCNTGSKRLLDLLYTALLVRTHKCSYCGLEMDRDVNTAIDILQKVGQGMPELTPVEMFVGTSAKQEAAVL